MTVERATIQILVKDAGISEAEATRILDAPTGMNLSLRDRIRAYSNDVLLALGAPRQPVQRIVAATAKYALAVFDAGLNSGLEESAEDSARYARRVVHALFMASGLSAPTSLTRAAAAKVEQAILYAVVPDLATEIQTQF